MASKISQLPLLNPVLSDAYLVLARNGNNYKVTVGALGQGISKISLGLHNVDNTSDLDKPLSNSTIDALSYKADKIHTHDFMTIVGLPNALASKAEYNHNHSKSEISGLSNDLNTIQNSLSSKLQVGVLEW